MTLPTNDDFANCELCIEELEAIAAGWPGWVRSIGRGLESAWHWVDGPSGRKLFTPLADVAVIALVIVSGGSIQKPSTNLN